MLNKYLLADKYDVFIGYRDKEDFIKDVSIVKNSINLQDLRPGPLLIFSTDNRNSLYYTLCISYSLKEDKILDYIAVSAQTIMTQHFMEMEKDFQLANDIYYKDLLFISMSQNDTVSDYLEKLIIEIVDFRHSLHKTTVVFMNTTNTGVTGMINQTSKLQAYFSSNHFQVLDITKQTGMKPAKRAKPSQPGQQIKPGRRII